MSNDSGEGGAMEHRACARKSGGRIDLDSFERSFESAFVEAGYWAIQSRT